jgi:hypothetical protein
MLAAIGTSGGDQPNVQVLLYTTEGQLRGQLRVFSPNRAWLGPAQQRERSCAPKWVLRRSHSSAAAVVERGFLTGQPTGQAMRYRSSQAVASARGNTLYLLGGHSHELVTVGCRGPRHCAHGRRWASNCRSSSWITTGSGSYINDTASRVYQIDLADLPRQKWPYSVRSWRCAGELTLPPRATVLAAQTDGDKLAGERGGCRGMETSPR